MLLKSNPVACLGLAAAILGLTLLYSLMYSRIYGNSPGTSSFLWCVWCSSALNSYIGSTLGCLIHSLIISLPALIRPILSRYIRNATLFVSFCLSIIGAALVDTFPPPGLSDASAFNDINIRRYAIAAIAVSAAAALALLIAEILRRRTANRSFYVLCLFQRGSSVLTCNFVQSRLPSKHGSR
jgi:hypothetical protein